MYCAIDFETTGLDTKRDEPIQVGIVIADENFKYQDHFVSLIKPHKPREELKTVVQLLTGFTLEQLETAPQPAEVFPHIQKYFTPDTILIGHNISFDEAFLRRYCPGLPQMQTIDTYPRSQYFVHFAPSYALESLVSHLEAKEEYFRHYTQTLRDRIYPDQQDQTFHDALYDAMLSLGLFAFCQKRHHTITQKYNLQDSQKSFCCPSYLPSLTQPVALHTKMQETNSPDTFPQKTEIATSSIPKRDISRVALTRLLRHFISTDEKIILALAHPQQRNIVERLTEQLGYRIGYLHPEQVFNADRIRLLLRQPDLSWEEKMFVYQYFSQHDKGYRIIDQNNDATKRICTFLSDQAAFKQNNLRLTTHTGLYYALRDDPDKWKDRKVCFLGADRRYQTFNKFLSTPVDPYQILSDIETILYEYKVLRHTSIAADKSYTQLRILRGKFIIRMALFFADTQEVMGQYHTNKITDCFLGSDPRFFKTLQSRKSITAFLPSVFALLAPGHTKTLQIHFRALHDRLYEESTISTKIFGQHHWFVLGANVVYSDFGEFLSLFEPVDLHLFSVLPKSGYHRYPLAQDSSQDTGSIILLKDRKKLIETILKKNTDEIFILNSAKQVSMKVIETLQHHGIDQTYQIYAENITGGRKKNIAKSSLAGKKIFIGGYNFLLGLLANGRTYDLCILHHLFGKLQHAIPKEIAFWGKQNYSDT